jgi:hypothetical protein
VGPFYLPIRAPGVGPFCAPITTRRRRLDPETMNRGDVVEVDRPFSDRTGSKTRPAVVVQADFLNGLIDDTVLVQVTGYPARRSKSTRLPRPGRG